MARTRKTWKQAESKTASPPPQIPAVDRTEGPDHPAYYEDPDKDKYKSGDTSSWAEDPHKPMSPESPPPAMPGNLTTEKLDHPGTSEFSEKPESAEQASDAGGGGGKSASEQPSLKQMAEQRANLCVRIASAMMPEADAGAVENKALELMDLDDSQLQATANTLKVLAGEEEEEEVVEEEAELEASKKATVEVTARLDAIEASMGKLVKAMTHFFGMEGEEDGMSDRELMAYLMAEDMDGDGVDQNDPQYGYEDKKSGEEEQSEFDRGEESEGTELSDEAEGDKMAMEEESMLRAMLEEMDSEMAMTAGKKAEDDEDDEDKEASKKASEAEETTEPLAKGPTIQSGEGGNVNPDEYAPTPVVAQSDGSEKVGDPTPHGKKADDAGVAENDIEITAGVDPMGLMDESQKEASADDELMQLYADLDLPKTAGEDAESDADDDIGGGDTLKDMEEVEEKAKEEGEEESPKASKKADDKGKKEPELKPQQKAASTGAQKLGNVSGQAKVAATEISELQKLWDTAPDVSEVFGVPGSS